MSLVKRKDSLYKQKFADDVTISGYNSVFSIINTSLISVICQKSQQGLHSHWPYETMEVRRRHGPADLTCRVGSAAAWRLC